MAEIVKDSEDPASYGEAKIMIALEAHHALNLVAFLTEFDLSSPQTLDYLRRSVEAYKNAVLPICSKEICDDAALKVQIEVMLGNAPNENKNGDKIV